jgi:hypothetical protein
VVTANILRIRSQRIHPKRFSRQIKAKQRKLRSLVAHTLPHFGDALARDLRDTAEVTLPTSARDLSHPQAIQRLGVQQLSDIFPAQLKSPAFFDQIVVAQVSAGGGAQQNEILVADLARTNVKTLRHC